MELTHYSSNPQAPIYFYGGPFSNFVCKQPLVIAWEQPWSSSPVELSYDTVEHAYQACKAVDARSHYHIAGQATPGRSKRAGNSTRLRRDWEQVKYDYMLIALRVKFTIPSYRDFLLGTGNRHIAEDSPTDFEWGIRDADGGLTGNNLLGKALMQVRQELQVNYGSGTEAQKRALQVANDKWGVTSWKIKPDGTMTVQLDDDDMIVINEDGTT